MIRIAFITAVILTATPVLAEETGQNEPLEKAVSSIDVEKYLDEHTPGGLPRPYCTRYVPGGDIPGVTMAFDEDTRTNECKDD